MVKQQWHMLTNLYGKCHQTITNVAQGQKNGPYSQHDHVQGH